MEVKLKSLTLSGFRSFRDESRISFEDSGLILIDGKREGGGSSGSGKSSITLAVQYAFGICDYPATDLVCTYPDSKIQVKVEGEIDGEPFVLCRGSVNSFVYKDISATGAKVVVEKLASSIGDLDLMKYSCFQNQQENSRFLALPDAQRKDFLGRILGIHKISAETEAQKKKAKDLESEIARIESQISDKKKHIESIRDSLKLFTPKEVPGLPEKKEEQLQSEIQNYNAAQEEKRKTLLEQKQSIQLEIENYTKIISTQSGLKAESDRLTRELEGLKVKAKALKEQKCPECEGPISDHQDKIDKIREQGKAIIEKIKAIQLVDTAEMATNKQASQKKLTDIETEIRKTYDKSPSQDSLRELLSLKKEIESAENWNAQLEKKKDNSIKLMQDSEQEVQSFQKTLEELVLKKALCLEFVDCFGNSGFVNQYVTEILEEIEIESNLIIEDIPNLSGIAFSFSNKTSDSGKNTVIPVITKNGIERPYRSFLSKGMCRSLELAVDLAVSNVIQRRSGVSFRTVFYDEPFDGLDFKSKESALEFFAMLSEQKAIYLIDHTSEIKEKFSSVLTVKFDGDKSVISTGG